MSIAAVCVDRGRLIVKEPSTSRVEGSTSFTPVPGPWFRCRLFLSASNDTTDPSAGRFSSVSQPQVLTPAKDLSGVRLVMHGAARMEILSEEFGRFVWRMLGEPQPLRKRSMVIGWQAFVERVVENQYDDLLNQSPPLITAPGL